MLILIWNGGRRGPLHIKFNFGVTTGPLHVDLTLLGGGLRGPLHVDFNFEAWDYGGLQSP